VAVAALAGTIAVALDLVVARRSRAQLAAAIGLLALTSVVLASALLRLRLYQDAYGWTELRFVVLVAIGWLAGAVVVTVVLLATRRTRWTLHVLGILALAVIAGMNVVGPQAYVTDRNLERALDPSLVPAGGRTGLDTPYLASLGDEAVPAVAAAVDRLPDTADRAALERFLDGRAAELRENPSLLGWPAWNLARERARAALAGRG
jgi:FlaA1/EpsC-like NDP-sugar epimerase